MEFGKLDNYIQKNETGQLSYTTHQKNKKTKQKQKQKNMLQTKEQGKNLQDQINEDEVGNLPEK